MAKQNPLWRLDILETEYLQKQARYRKTTALLKSKKKKHVLPESKDAALKEIEALKSDIFGNKIHSSFIKYQRALKKATKALSGKKRTTTADGELEFYKNLDLEEITKVRVVKQVSQVFKISRKKLDTEPENIPKFIPRWLLDDLKLPSNFYNGLTNEQRNWYSKVLNHKDVKEISGVIENSFRLILGPVKEHKRDIEDVQGNGSESDDSESESDSESETGTTKVSQIKHGEKEAEEEEEEEEEEEAEDYSQYDYLVAGSEDEVEDGQLKFENETSYNSATDIESSEEDSDGFVIGPDEENDDEDEIDDFFEDESKQQKKAKVKASKHVLPSLATGYFSGGESEEIEDDKFAQEIIRPQRKNRRGQRARQKLWELKYGKDANHFKKQQQAKEKERERKQKEYEERVARRAALGITKSGSNTTPLSRRNDAPSQQKEKLHPSWEAKKKAQESQKNAKFQGKKITFD